MQLPTDPKLIRKQADNYETIALIMVGLVGLILLLLNPAQNTYPQKVGCFVFTLGWGSLQLGLLAVLTRRKAAKIETKKPTV